MGPADALSCKNEVDTSNDNQDVILLPPTLFIKAIDVALTDKIALFSPSDLLLHSMHWTMGNHSLPEHPSTTGTMIMGNSTSRINYTSLKWLDKT